jgi:hypothetical protein
MHALLPMRIPRLLRGQPTNASIEQGAGAEGHREFEVATNSDVLPACFWKPKYPWRSIRAQCGDIDIGKM